MIEEGWAAWIARLPRAGSLLGLFSCVLRVSWSLVASTLSHALDGSGMSPGPMPAFMVRFVACGDDPASAP
jgi:hypothetical protein